MLNTVLYNILPPETLGCFHVGRKKNVLITPENKSLIELESSFLCRGLSLTVPTYTDWDAAMPATFLLYSFSTAQATPLPLSRNTQLTITSARPRRAQRALAARTQTRQASDPRPGSSRSSEDPVSHRDTLHLLPPTPPPPPNEDCKLYLYCRYPMGCDAFEHTAC